MSALTAENLTSFAQEYDDLDQQRLKLGREIKVLEDRTKAMKQLLIAHLKNSGSTAIGCSTAVFTLKEEFEVAGNTNWSDLRDHIIATGEWELMEKRVSKAAVKERWEIGETIPGVSKFPVTKLSRSGV